MRVTVKSRLPASAEVVWDLVKKSRTTAYVCEGMISYKNVAEWPIEWVAGETTNTTLLLAGKFPIGDHQINIVARDESARTINTKESGGALERWDHEMSVVDIDGEQCYYQDSIEIDAGIATAAIVAYAHVYYRYRHRRWLKLLANNR